MFYAIQLNATNVISGQYEGSQPLPEPWIAVSAAQYAQILPGSSWVNNAVVAPPVAAAAPSLAQQAATLIAAGLTIAGTTTPALNGVYIVQSGIPFGQEDIATEAQFISTFGEFTNGTSAGLQWPLLNGTPVTFTTTAAFLNFAKSAAQFVAAVKGAVLLNTALPPATATIP